MACCYRSAPTDQAQALPQWLIDAAPPHRTFAVAVLANRSRHGREMIVKSERTGTDVAVVVRLPVELREALAARAVEEDRSVASILRVAARAYLRRAAEHTS